VNETEPNSSANVSSAKLMASRRRFIALLLIAFGPMFIAYATFFYFPDWAPTGTTNEGQLISPSIDGLKMSQELATFSTWVLIQPIKSSCGDQCREMLYLSRQVVIGLGKDANRVQRVALTSADTPALMEHLEVEHPDVKVVSGMTAYKPIFTDDGPVLLLMDPNHNVMMLYSLDKAGKPMLRDLKHLLKISNIG